MDKDLKYGDGERHFKIQPALPNDQGESQPHPWTAQHLGVTYEATGLHHRNRAWRQEHSTCQRAPLCQDTAEEGTEARAPKGILKEMKEEDWPQTFFLGWTMGKGKVGKRSPKAQRQGVRWVP